MTYLTPVLPIVCVIFLIATFRLQRSRLALLLRATAVVLFLWSWPPVAWLLSASLEHSFRPALYPDGDADVIVVLSAGIQPLDPTEAHPLPDGHTYLRCQRAIWLYKNWRPLPIVVSGGPLGSGVIIADVMRSVLEAEGVPPGMIWTERTSTSTYENARNTAALLRLRGIRRVVLITEGYSMLRAMKALQHAGLLVVPSPCTFRMYESRSGWKQLLPDATSILSNEDALHEWVGLAWYRLSGKA